MPAKPANREISAFVTIWALLDIKLIGSDLKHVVALDAHAVEDGADLAACLAHGLHAGWMLVDGSIGGRLGGHERILTRGGVLP
jgi:hypothetical protein